jgi:2-methylcitrate dehydratase PrpD
MAFEEARVAKERLLDFVTQTRYDDLPESVQRQVVRALGDLLGAMVAGTHTPTAGITARYAAEILPGSQATVAGLGKVCNGPGAALANGVAANALDIDDGFRPSKGHPGAVVIPAALAQAEACGASGDAFLAAVAVGYEVGLRCSVAWHTGRPFYHGTGSWGAVGAAAACASLLELDQAATLEALGIAEYHGPLAPIMVAVRHPGMVKDGIHWGALAGITAAQLAGRGFTGIPPFLAERAHSELVASLGQEWWIERLYFKFYPCCRWAQPAIAAVLDLRARHGIRPEEVERIVINTFAAATHLKTRHPQNTEEAQYSLPFPVACGLVRGRVTVQEIARDGLTDPDVHRMSDRVEMVVDPALEARFPAEALAGVAIELKNGDRFVAGPRPAPGDADDPPSDEALWAKYRELTVPVMGARRAEQLRRRVLDCAQLDGVGKLTELLTRFLP